MGHGAAAGEERRGRARMAVVATAGHVDHGKSTLLRRLTGMEPDRWEEERRRGLTIDLGFVWCELPDPDDAETEPLTVAFVDVPGHERFVPNMLAGAGAVRLALFVVAADDGWSAQSEEHLRILDLLGVEAAVVAVTKASLVDADRSAQVASDVAGRLAGTTLAGAPVLVVDGLDGTGVDALAATLARRLRATARPADRGRPRLWVDRAFTISGAGTVVTGTLEGGALHVGDEVAVLPDARPARVRGLQSLGRAVDTAEPGARVAVNLAQIDLDDIGRGDAVVGARAGSPAEAWLVTAALDTVVHAVAPHEVDRRGAWHLHLGSAEVTCRVRPLLDEPVAAGGSGYVRLLLDRPLPVRTGDRFVLREAGRQATVGGGQVLDPAPVLRVRGVDARLERAEALDAITAAGPDRLLALVAAGDGARLRHEALAAADLPLDHPLPDGLTRVGAWLVTDPARVAWSEAVLAAARAHHDRDPASPGPDRTALGRAARDAGCPARLAPELVDHLAGEGELRRHGSAYALPDHAPARDEARDRRQQDLLDLLARDPLAPPDLKTASRETGVNYQEVQQLVQGGALVKCGDIAFTRGAVDAAIDRLRGLEAEVGAFTASQARERWGTTRKYAIPLLEHLDAAGVTTFDGTTRRLRAEAG